MPHFRVETNLLRSKVPLEFVNKAIPIIAKALGKPEQKCVCTLVPDMLVSFGGDSTAPAATGSLMSIGKLGPEENKSLAKELAGLVQRELGVDCKRFMLTFHDASPWNVSVRGTTAQALSELVDQ